MSDTQTKTKKVQIWTLSETSRPLFQYLISDPIPDDAAYIVTSEDGYTLLTKEEKDQLFEGQFVLPQIAFLTYYVGNVAYQD